MQEHQRQSFGVYGDLLVHGGVVAVQGLPAALNGSVEYIHKVVGRFALRDGRARVVCACAGFYRAAYGERALFFNGQRRRKCRGSNGGGGNGGAELF